MGQPHSTPERSHAYMPSMTTNDQMASPAPLEHVGDEAEAKGGKCHRTLAPKRRKQRGVFIGSRRGSVSPDQFRDRIAGLGISQRAFARAVGRSERSTREILAGDIIAPCSIHVELAYLELLRDLAALIAKATTGVHISKVAARALLEQHVPPVRKAEKAVKSERVAKPPPAPKAIKKKRYRRKTYDQPYTPWPQEPHPIMRTVMMGIGGTKR